MTAYKENYYARYVYNAVSEFVYFIIIYIRQNGEANISNIMKYMKFFKYEVNCFVESFQGATQEEQLKNMLCTSTVIFSASDNYLTLTEKQDTYKKYLYEDIISSKAIDLILKGVYKLDDIWCNLKLNNVLFYVDKHSLLTMLSRSVHFDISDLNSISINQLKGVLGFDTITYKTVINYFQSYLQNNKKLSYFEVEMSSSFLPICEMNNTLKILCIMFCSSFFKCKESCIKLKTKLKKKSQQKRKLDVRKSFMKETAHSMSIGYVVYKEYGRRLTNWKGEIGSLSHSNGLIYCVTDFIDCNQGIFCIYFNKTSLQQVSEVNNLGDYLGVRDIVEFDAEYCGKSKKKDTYWKATRIEVIKTTFEHNHKVFYCDNSIEDVLNSFQQDNHQSVLAQKDLYNQYGNNLAAIKSKSFSNLHATTVSNEEKLSNTSSSTCPLSETENLRKENELKALLNHDAYLKNDPNFVTEKDSSLEKESKLKTLSLLAMNSINNNTNLGDVPFNAGLEAEKNGKGVFPPQTSLTDGNLETSKNESRISDTETIDASSELQNNFLEVTCEMLVVNNKSCTSLITTEFISNSVGENVKALLCETSKPEENKSFTPLSNTKYNCSNKALIDQEATVNRVEGKEFCISLSSAKSNDNEKVENNPIQLECIASNSEKNSFYALLSNNESICNNKTENGTVQQKCVAENLSSSKMTPVFDIPEPIHNEKIAIIDSDADKENSLKTDWSTAVSPKESQKKISHNIDSEKKLISKSLSVPSGASMFVENHSKEASMVKNFDKPNNVLQNYLFNSSRNISATESIASNIPAYSMEIDEKVNEHSGEFKIFYNTKENSANKSSFLKISNLEFSNFIHMFGYVTLVTDGSGIASSMYKNNQFDVFFRLETIHPMNNLEVVKPGQKVLLYIPYGAEKGNAVFAATFVYLLKPKEIIQVEKHSLSANEFVKNSLHVLQKGDHDYHSSCLGICNHMVIDISLRPHNAFVTYMHIARLLNRKFQKKTKIHCERKNRFLKKTNVEMLSNNIFHKEHNFSVETNSANYDHSNRLSSPKCSTEVVSQSNSSPASKSEKNSLSSSSSFVTCDSYEDANEEVFYSCESAFNTDESLENECSTDKSFSTVPNKMSLSSTSVPVYLSQSVCNETLIADSRDKLLDVECNRYSLSNLARKQYDYNNDFNVTNSNFKKYFKLKSIPIFKQRTRKTNVKLINKYGCKKCLRSIIVKEAFVNLITETCFILSMKIKEHNVFLGYPKHLIPDDTIDKIKVNSIVIVALIQEKILNFSHVLALELCIS